MSQLFPACLCQLRLTQFPKGLGKGSDAAVVGSWLETVLDAMNIDLENSVPES